MKILVGLGNPGKEYEKTRHNAGFMVIDRLAEEEKIRVIERKHQAIIGKGMIGSEKVVLVKPQTYMNLSGNAVKSVVDFYKVNPEEDVIVISDDIDLPTGSLRIRKSGSAGGHNGLKNIIAMLSTQQFTRIRVGVGDKPNGADLADHVLGHFNKEDSKAMEEATKVACDAIREILSGGVDMAMNRYNRKVKEEAKEENA